VNWDLLTESYAKSGIVLALGAGVSLGSRLPTWSGLLSRLAADSADTPDIDGDALIKDGLALPVIASILEEQSPDRAHFAERVRQALYKDFPFFRHGVDKGNRGEFVRFIREENRTLHAVGTLCAIPTARRRYEPNRRVRGIVTFNLDALLQAYVYARFEKRLLRTIERASASSSSYRINVYHMHGFLRFDGHAGDLRKDGPDSLVLTEQDYFNFFNDPTSLFNYTFLYLLREATCLFIGLSMQDENIRRILHLSKLERVRALQNEGVVPEEARQRALRHFAILRRSAAQRLDDAIELALRPLGTNVLWINDWPEIEQQLRRLYEAPGENWDAVK
jgi:hypothetical protein